MERIAIVSTCPPIQTDGDVFSMDPKVYHSIGRNLFMIATARYDWGEKPTEEQWLERVEFLHVNEVRDRHMRDHGIKLMQALEGRTIICMGYEPMQYLTGRAPGDTPWPLEWVEHKRADIAFMPAPIWGDIWLNHPVQRAACEIFWHDLLAVQDGVVENHHLEHA